MSDEQKMNEPSVGSCSEDQQVRESQLLEPLGPSEIAIRVRTLKNSVFSVAEKRQHLPKQLFWSLFHSEIDEIKQRKARKRILNLIS